MTAYTPLQLLFVGSIGVILGLSDVFLTQLVEAFGPYVLNSIRFFFALITCLTAYIIRSIYILCSDIPSSPVVKVEKRHFFSSVAASFLTIALPAVLLSSSLRSLPSSFMSQIIPLSLLAFHLSTHSFLSQLIPLSILIFTIMLALITFFLSLDAPSNETWLSLISAIIGSLLSGLHASSESSDFSLLVVFQMFIGLFVSITSALSVDGITEIWQTIRSAPSYCITLASVDGVFACGLASLATLYLSDVRSDSPQLISYVRSISGFILAAIIRSELSSLKPGLAALNLSIACLIAIDGTVYAIGQSGGSPHKPEKSRWLADDIKMEASENESSKKM